MKVFVAIMMALALPVVARAEALDGTQWTIKVTPDAEAKAAGESEFDDELSFADDKVTMSECVKFGFAASVYLTSGPADARHWNTIQHSAAEGVANWSGTVKGDVMTGKLAWAKRDGTKLVYTFTGTRKAAAPPPAPAEEPKTK